MTYDEFAALIARKSGLRAGLDVLEAWKKIGTDLNSPDPESWESDDVLLEAFYRVLNTETNLLGTIEQVESSDDYALWLKEARAALFSAPEFDANFQMYYRYDFINGVYQWAEEKNSPTWMSQEEADALPSAIAGAAPPGDVSDYSEPEFDDNYGLFYRFSRSQRTYEWARQKDALEWMSQAQADALLAASQAPGAVAPGDAYAEPEFDDRYGMFYRFNRTQRAYEWAREKNAAEWMSQAQADALLAASSAPGAYTEPEFDDRYGMFYRFNRTTEVYEWAYAKDAAEWMSQAQADATRRAAPPAAVTPAEAELAEWLVTEKANLERDVIDFIRGDGLDEDEFSDEDIRAFVNELVRQDLGS